MFLRNAANTASGRQPPASRYAQHPLDCPALAPKCDMWRGVADLFAYNSADVHKKYKKFNKKIKNKQQQQLQT